MRRALAGLIALLTIASVLPASAQRARGATGPDPCTLFTKAELQQLTGHSDVMKFPNMPDQLPSGGRVCTIDGGGRGAQALEIELIIYSRMPGTHPTLAKGAEAVTGVGEYADYQQSPGNGAAYGQKGAWALHVGVQSGDSAQNIRTSALALLKAGVAKLP
jgi:hypothetical protein